MLAPVEAVLPWPWDGDPRAPVAFGRCLCRAEGSQPRLGDFPSTLTARGPWEARREVVLRTVAGTTWKPLSQSSSWSPPTGRLLRALQDP